MIVLSEKQNGCAETHWRRCTMQFGSRNSVSYRVPWSSSLSWRNRTAGGVVSVRAKGRTEGRRQQVGQLQQRKWILSFFALTSHQGLYISIYMVHLIMLACRGESIVSSPSHQTLAFSRHSEKPPFFNSLGIPYLSHVDTYNSVQA